MSILTPVGAEILIAGVTIMWGIIVETWFVSRWTIFFNIVPLIASLAVFDGNAGIVWIMFLFLLISIPLVIVSGKLRHIVGAKGYGTLSLNVGLLNANIIVADQFLVSIVITGIVVFFLWFIMMWAKSQ